MTTPEYCQRVPQPWPEMAEMGRLEWAVVQHCPRHIHQFVTILAKPNFVGSSGSSRTTPAKFVAEVRHG